MRKPLTLLAIALATAACSQQAPNNAYTLDGIVAETTADSAFLYDTFSSELLASAPIVDGAFHFEGTVDSVRSIAIVVKEKTTVFAYLEPGTMRTQLDELCVTGTPLNDEDAGLTRRFDALQKRAEQGEDIDLDAEMQKEMAAIMPRHKNDALGYYYFLNIASYYMTIDEMDAFMQDAGPIFQNSPLVQKKVESKRRRQATEVGKPYIDIEGQLLIKGLEETHTASLKGFLNLDKLVLVDFWASWCGPCRREIPNIKACAEKYAKEVNVVGIAVWDKMPDTQQAMQDLGIAWPVIFNEREATDAYAIEGIPHIMLLASDGTILARDLRGEAIDKAIAKALGK